LLRKYKVFSSATIPGFFCTDIALRFVKIVCYNKHTIIIKPMLTFKNKREWERLPSVPFLHSVRLLGVGGVYFLADANGQLLYVGASQNVYNRISAHRRGGLFPDCVTVYYCDFGFMDSRNLAEIESACIFYYEPLRNKRI